MSGRLKRLALTPGAVRQPRVEFFDVTCLCGRSTSGQRLPRPQAVECPDCGEGLFVLPIDAYPSGGFVGVCGGWPAAGRRRPTFTAGWLRAGLAAAAHLASGRLLLIAILATMTASLLFAFWIDAQSRRAGGRPAGSPERMESTAASIDPAVQHRSMDPAERTLTGRIQDGAVVIDGTLNVPDGTPVAIRVIPDSARRRGTSGEAHR